MEGGEEREGEGVERAVCGLVHAVGLRPLLDEADEIPESPVDVREEAQNPALEHAVRADADVALSAGRVRVLDDWHASVAEEEDVVVAAARAEELRDAAAWSGGRS